MITGNPDLVACNVQKTLTKSANRHSSVLIFFKGKLGGVDSKSLNGPATLGRGCLAAHQYDGISLWTTRKLVKKPRLRIKFHIVLWKILCCRPLEFVLGRFGRYVRLRVVILG